MGENSESLTQLARDLSEQNAKMQAILVESYERSLQRMLESQERNMQRVIDALQPAARDAVAPVGKTCSCMQVSDTPKESEDKTFVLDEAAARAVRAHKPGPGHAQPNEPKIFPIRLISIAISSRKCRFRVEGSRGPSFKGNIYDPTFRNPGDPYTSALSARRPLEVWVEEIRIPNKRPEFNILSVVTEDTDA